MNKFHLIKHFIYFPLTFHLKKLIVPSFSLNSFHRFFFGQQEVKGSREEVTKTLNEMETKYTSTPRNSEVLMVNNEWKNEFKRLGKQSIVDITDLKQ